MPSAPLSDPQIRLVSAGQTGGSGDPSAVSTQIFDQEGDMPNVAGLSNLFVAWGQFLDHDLSLTPESETETLTSADGQHSIHRSVTDENGDPLNAITWQIDGSQIYGSDAGATDYLRSFEGGHLRMGDLDWSGAAMLPDSHTSDGMLGKSPGKCPFLAGDIRANENPALNSMHTLMAREHNHWADRLAEEHPEWSDDQLFEGARQIVEYQLQKITYEEWLPHLIGDAVGEDTGFDPDVDGQISVEFSTAAFRFGHTMVSGEIAVMNEDGSEGEGGNIDLMEAFFDPNPLRLHGIDDILRGQTSTSAQELDAKVIDDLNFMLFNEDGTNGMSLVGLNVLRGQDHGLASYVETRAALIGDIEPDALDPADFSIISSNADVQAQLAAVYDTVHDVDLWVGGLAEDDVDGTQLGPLFTYIIADQFARVRAADEGFGELDPALGADIIAEVQGTRLTDIILRNTQIDHMQDDPFVVMDRGLTDAGDIIGTGGHDQIDLVAKNILGAITTGSGRDILTLSGGTKVAGGIVLGGGDDTLVATSGIMSGSVLTGEGADRVTFAGEATAGLIDTGADKDRVDLTENSRVDTVQTGGGNDTVKVCPFSGARMIDTGKGHDRIVLEGQADVGAIDGGAGFDQITLRGTDYRIAWQDDDPTTQAGTIIYLDEAGAPTGRETTFTNIEQVTCFTPGTRVISGRGSVPVEDLRPGDKVWTLDHGLQPLRWIGRTTVLAEGRHAPISIAAGALGNSRDMEVSPQHRMLLADWRCELVCGAGEVLAPALHLMNDASITRRTGGTVDYIHLLFDSHQIVFADGIPSESFHPGARALDAMSDATRAEILDLFPQLEADLSAYGPAARPMAKPHEVHLIRAIPDSDRV